MKEVLNNQTPQIYDSHYKNRNGESNSIHSSNKINFLDQYAIFSTGWISTLCEELGLPSLSETLIRKLAEDVSYRLREILHKCILRLRHSKRKCLMSDDINFVLKNLYSIDSSFGAPEELPKYLTKFNIFLPHDYIIDLICEVNKSQSFSQTTIPFFQDIEWTNSKLSEERNHYAKKALKILFNSSQKTFQVLLNECSSNVALGEEVVDKLMLIARSMVISNNAQYTRVSTRTCQLIIAVTSNSKAVYPHHLHSVEKLTELLLELLLGQGFINTNLEMLFKSCALKLILRWPLLSNRFIPMLKNVLIAKDENNIQIEKKIIAIELLTSVEPLIFLKESVESPIGLTNVLKYAVPSSIIWHKIAMMIHAFVKSGRQPLNYTIIFQHFGDSILPYLTVNFRLSANICKSSLPIILKNKIKYAKIRRSTRGKISDNKVFLKSISRVPRREIRFSFAGGRSVPSSNLRRINLRANYQILRTDYESSYALIASHRLIISKHKRKRFLNTYHLSNIIL